MISFKAGSPAKEAGFFCDIFFTTVHAIDNDCCPASPEAGLNYRNKFEAIVCASSKL
ncbi:hypothetical protein LV84_03205 [Algoriphagus ratkowskyi]|uniref:Uncharacterized protein n=1 Tax=Algoriphagus ratkowskyi TaxID=57028 RepID=A0A2W7QZZ8_9BACT|nr:hypothetical protein LV84_03205 [Algoriphagus ratkowskyi]